MEDAAAGLRLLYCTPEKIVNSKRFFARVRAAAVHAAGCQAGADPFQTNVQHAFCAAPLLKRSWRKSTRRGGWTG